jgi:hypothetical protein
LVDEVVKAVNLIFAVFGNVVPASVIHNGIAIILSGEDNFGYLLYVCFYFCWLVGILGLKQ